MRPFDAQKRKNLAARVGSALVLFPLAVWLTVVGGFPFAVLAGLAAALAASELVLMFAPLGPGELFGVLVAGAIPFIAAFSQTGQLLPDWAGLFLACATVLLLGFYVFRQGPLEAVPKSISAVALAWLYCGLLLATVVSLRIRFGVAWVILAFVVTWLNDTFAYFAGHAFGKHKLLERISPKKTWEGFLGGAVGSVTGALVVRALLPSLQADLSLGTAAVVGAGGAVLGPLGDLAESMVKRAAGVKDSGRLIPGHGGLLDRIDALLFVSPWVCLCAAWFTGR